MQTQLSLAAASNLVRQQVRSQHVLQSSSCAAKNGTLKLVAFSISGECHHKLPDLFRQSSIHARASCFRWAMSSLTAPVELPLLLLPELLPELLFPASRSAMLLKFWLSQLTAKYVIREKRAATFLHPPVSTQISIAVPLSCAVQNHPSLLPGPLAGLHCC